jgi:hypothetical protein
MVEQGLIDVIAASPDYQPCAVAAVVHQRHVVGRLYGDCPPFLGYPLSAISNEA